MATFRVGQRVRIARWVDGDYDFAGKEATVISDLVEHEDGTLVHDLYINGMPNDADEPWCAVPEELEPIQPERNRVVAWEDLNLPFDPRKVGEVA